MGSVFVMQCSPVAMNGDIALIFLAWAQGIAIGGNSARCGRGFAGQAALRTTNRWDFILASAQGIAGTRAQRTTLRWN